jgi:putative ABC transport system permease protein
VKVSARNLFRYKKRFWMTVIGVAGCTGLLIAGLGLRTSIFSIIDIQYGNVYQYDIQSTLDTDTAGVQDQVAALLDSSDQVVSYAKANTRSVSFQSESGTADGYLTVTDDPASLETQIDFHTMADQTFLEISDSGILIDEKLAELLEVEVGDTITIDCGQRVEAQVLGINEHYIYHYAYMTAQQYTALTGNDYEANEFLITTQTSETTQLCKDLMAIDGVRTASNLVNTATTFRETLSVVNAAVTIIVLSAAALALVVLYNLTNINITERIRELATIKVLGFYDREVAMYIYRENIVLTVLGIALGQVLGKFLCTYLIRTIEMDIVMFGRQALPRDYGLSVVLSLGFALLVNFMMYFRMKKIDMVQSLKSVE